MEEKKKSYRASVTALCFVVVAVLLQFIEAAAKDYHLEFRIYVQVFKGIFIWLIMPLVVAFAVEHDFIREKVGGFFRYLVLTILVILILGVSCFRGLVFFFGEMIEEEVLEDGRIRGCWSTLAGDVFYYYDPVYGIFKRPFPGWSEDELEEELWQRHGEGISLVEVKQDGSRIYQASGIRPGIGPFYFQTWGDYLIEDNFLYSLMKSDAVGFWANKKKRALAFVKRSQVIELEEEDLWNNKDNPGNEDQLMVNCHSKEDVMLCAADLADWLFYAAEDGRYFAETDDPETDRYLWAKDVLFSIWINYRDDETGSWEKRQESFLSVKEPLLEGDWGEVKTQLEERLSGYYERLAQKKAEKADREESWQENEAVNDTVEEDTAQDIAEWEERFLEYYRDDYEKEVFLPDGITGYRMVVLDAALGSRMYGLLKSTDQGESWQVANRDPFGSTGMGIDFTFLDEEFGFATLMHNGGDEAELYVTEDGGKSYEMAVLQGLTVTLEDGYVYNPYDYPQMPYMEDGRLYLLCGQGADGDYNGGDGAALALFESTDHGHMFVFKEMRERKDS